MFHNYIKLLLLFSLSTSHHIIYLKIFNSIKNKTNKPVQNDLFGIFTNIYKLHPGTFFSNFYFPLF